MKLRRQFNLPLSYFGQGFQNMDYPIWNNPNSGNFGNPNLPFGWQGLRE
jgi:hypothetical protein